MRVVRNTDTQSVLFHFDDCRDYADTVEKRCTPYHSGGSWVGGETWSQSVQRARSGNIDLVPAAEALVDKLTVEAQRTQATWVPSLAGAFPCVPDYLAGRPDCMRRKYPQPNERAPIKIYVDLTSSGAVSAADMVKRGTAILALALLLNMERSVELHTIVSLDSRAQDLRACFAVVPLGASPLDIALACNALTSVGFVRSMGYGFLSQSQESRAGGGWAWGIMPTDDRSRCAYVEKLRKTLDVTTEDIIIPPVHCYDPILKDPITFVRRALADALRIEQEA